MSGGINAWEGLTAEGAPESGMAYFPEAAGPNELLTLAWKLEEGSRIFYKGIHSMIKDLEAAELFKDLASAEEHHKAALLGLYKELFGSLNEDGPAFSVPSQTSDQIMEGGIKVSEALSWAGSKDLHEILEFAMSAEANAYDLYIKMGRKLHNSSAKKIFKLLSIEEKNHLGRMALLLEKKI